MQYLVVEVPRQKLRRHALSCTWAARCPDVVLAVAADPSHELHGLAIGTIAFDFGRLVKPRGRRCA
jgi:hypothetical protein